jgi:hypothetical protein
LRSSSLSLANGRGSARAAARAELQTHGIAQRIIAQVADDPSFNPYQVELPRGELEWVVAAQNKVVLADAASASPSALAAARILAMSEMQNNDALEPIIREVLSNPGRLHGRIGNGQAELGSGCSDEAEAGSSG